VALQDVKIRHAECLWKIIALLGTRSAQVYTKNCLSIAHSFKPSTLPRLSQSAHRYYVANYANTRTRNCMPKTRPHVCKHSKVSVRQEFTQRVQTTLTLRVHNAHSTR